MASIHRRRRGCIVRFVALILAAGLCHPAPVDAHAIVLDSVPAPGDAVPGPALEVMIQFNSRVDAARSQLVLERPDGSAAPLAILPQRSEDRLEAAVESLAPGDYTLIWQVLSVDGHITRGILPFSVTAP